MLCKIGDIAVVRNFKQGIIECPVIYVSQKFIVVKSKFYKMVININGKKFDPYIDELNEFLEIKKEDEFSGIYSERIW